MAANTAMVVLQSWCLACHHGPSAAQLGPLIAPAPHAPTCRLAEVAPCGAALELCCREELLTQLARLSHVRLGERGWHHTEDDGASAAAWAEQGLAGDDEVLDWGDADSQQQAQQQQQQRLEQDEDDTAGAEAVQPVTRCGVDGRGLGAQLGCVGRATRCRLLTCIGQYCDTPCS